MCGEPEGRDRAESRGDGDVWGARRQGQGRE